MKRYLFLVSLSVFAAACGHKDKAVNNTGAAAYVPLMVLDNQVTQDSLARSPQAALEGRVMMDGNIPTPLSNVQLTIFQESKGQKEQLLQLSTDARGHFQVTRKMSAGRYEIRITDQRYLGSLEVTLESAPALGLVVTADKRK